MKAKRLFGYVRVSHDEQKKYGYSVQAQIERIIKYAEDTGSQLVEIFVDEGFTATNMKRPELLRMLDNLNDCDVIVFTRLDRFSRNVLQANNMVKMMEEFNVGIKSIEEDDIDTSTADGKFNFDLRVSLAEREAKKTSERIKSVFEFKIKNGQPVSGGQPFGYVIETIGDKEKKIIKDKETENIVNDIFEHFAIHHSVRKTMFYINDKYDLERGYNTYYKIITDTEYYGEYKGNLNYYPQYITKEEYLKNQKRLKAQIKQGRHKHTYLFTSLLYCPICKNKMTGKHIKRKNKNGTVAEHWYYACGGNKREKKCNNKKCINEKVILEYLFENVEELAKKHIAEVLEVKPSDETVSHEKRIKEILEEMDRIKYSFHKKRISIKEYDRDFEALENELTKLSIEDNKEDDIAILEEFLRSDWKDIYDSLDKENQRALWRNLIKEIRFTEDFKIEVIFL